jgi:hypothetical protein
MDLIGKSNRHRLIRLAIYTGLTAALSTIAACGGPVVGSPAPSPSSGATATTVTSSSPALPVSRPCSLVSATDLAQLGSSAPVSTDLVGGVATCEIAAPNASVGVGFMPMGLAQFVVNGTIKDLIIGRHHAKEDQSTIDTSSCYIAIGLTSTMRLDISVESDSGVAPCQLALQAATLVERHLPVS